MQLLFVLFAFCLDVTVFVMMVAMLLVIGQNLGSLI
jgi:hypothetical protein